MKSKKILVGLLFLGLTLTGCDDFLSETPDNRTQIDSPKKAAQLLGSAYPNGSFAIVGEIMSDNAFDSGRLTTTDVTNTEMYKWQIVTDESYDSPTEYWQACYNAIAHANTAIIALDEFILDYESKNLSTKLLKSMRAEGLIARAYAHFLLVNLWGPTYNPETADSDLGVPYVTVPETALLAKYERNSVGEVYDLIEKDLVDGFKDLTEDHIGRESIKYHFNLKAAHAFAARFYTFKGDWDKVIEHTQYVENPTGLLRNAKALSLLEGDAHANAFTTPANEANFLVGTVRSLLDRSFASKRFNFGNNIAREILFSDKHNPYGRGFNFMTMYFRNSTGLYTPRYTEYFKITDPTNMTGQVFTNVVLLSSDFMFFDRMEALVMKNDFDAVLTGLSVYFRGVTDTNSILPKLTFEQIKTVSERSFTQELDPFYELTEEQLVYLRVIADSRRRESYSDGWRWMDVRRFNIEVEHAVNGEGTDILVKGDPRRQLQLPLMAISNGIEANPR